MTLHELLADQQQRLAEITGRADDMLGETIARHNRLHAGFLVDPEGTAERMREESEAVLREMAGLEATDGPVDAE